MGVIRMTPTDIRAACAAAARTFSTADEALLAWMWKVTEALERPAAAPTVGLQQDACYCHTFLRVGHAESCPRNAPVTPDTQATGGATHAQVDLEAAKILAAPLDPETQRRIDAFDVPVTAEVMSRPVGGGGRTGGATGGAAATRTLAGIREYWAGIPGETDASFLLRELDRMTGRLREAEEARAFERAEVTRLTAVVARYREVLSDASADAVAEAIVGADPDLGLNEAMWTKEAAAVLAALRARVGAVGNDVTASKEDEGR